MNILFLDQFSEMGGAQRCLIDLLPAIRRRGWSAHLAIPGQGPLYEFGRLYCDSITIIPCGPFHPGEKSRADLARFAYQLPLQALSIARIVARHKIDVLYVNGPRLLPSVALVAGKRPLVFHAHSRIAQPAVARLAGSSLRLRHATVLACCAFVAGSWERTRIVYNGVPGFAPSARKHSAWLRIGIIGRIAPEKGTLEFIRAARLVAPHAANCRFTVCGAPMFSKPEYAKQVRAEASGLPIEFIGWRDNLAPVFAGLDLLVVPSGPNDASPRVIPEAYSAGVPILAFRSGGIPEILENGHGGWLVEATAEALAAKLRELAQDPDQRTRAAEQTRNIWLQKYTVERYQGEILDVLERFEPNHQRRPFQRAGASTPA